MALSDDNLRDLNKAVTWSLQKLEPFLEERDSMIRQYVGPHWSEANTREGRPLNMIELFVIIILAQLSGRNPKVRIGSKYQDIRPSAYALELQVNVLAEQLRLGEIIEDAVLDALFGLGVAKVGEYADGQFNYNDQTYMARKPFVQNIDMADWVHDMAARRWNEIQFEGHFYRLDRSVLESSPLYDAEAVKRFLESSGDSSKTVRTHTTHDIQTGGDQGHKEYRQRHEVLDLWLPMERMLLTLPPFGPWDSSSILRQRRLEKQDPEPFKKLALNRVPDATMPLAPTTNLRDLDELMNTLMEKMGKRAKRAKENPVYGPGAEEQAQIIKNAQDGEWVALNNPNVTKVATGGIDGSQAAFILALRDMFTYQAGNLDLLGGLSGQTATLGQDQILAKNASQRVSAMQVKTVRFIREIMRDLAWYVYHDPVMEYEVEKLIPGTDMTVLSRFGPDQRSTAFIDFAFELDPYSSQYRSPQERWATLQQALQALAPFIPLAAQQGIVPNVAAMARAAARLLDAPEFDEFFEIGQPPPHGPGSPSQPELRGSPVTQRINQRISRPGVTSEGRNRMLMERMSGQNLQPAENAAVARSA